MAKNRSSKPKISAKATAKAELVAKATYERKHLTTEVVPPDVTRAKAGAWLDVISPITQWAGLKGDQLKYKRELLRVQQDETLNLIVELARKKLASLGKEISVVPHKFLVPFLERASLEDEQSELCERWADLLVSAATTYDPSMVRFSAVLAEIGPAEVNLLHRLVRKCRGKKGLNHIEDVPFLFFHNVIPRSIAILANPQKTEKKLYKELIDNFEYPGTVWPFIGIGDWEFSNTDWSDKDDAIASNLVSVGILHLVDGLEGKVGKLEWYGRLYAITTFGLRFLFACDLSIKEDFTRINEALMKQEIVAENSN